MRICDVLLLLAVFCCTVPSAAGQRMTRPEVTNRSGIPFPTTRDSQAWQRWRQQVRSQIQARRAASHANAASGGSSGIIETLAGAAPLQTTVTARKTGFGIIEDIVEDPAGNLFIASCDLGVVIKVDSSSDTTVYAGKPLPVGPAISAGDGGPATSARIPCPTGLALDASNNLFITDTASGTVREVDAATGIIQTIAGTPGQFGHAGDGGPGISALLEYPTALALDGQGNLFIEDEDYLWRLNLSSGVIQTFAGSGATSNPCALSASTQCPALQTNFYFTEFGIAVNGSYLYAAPAFTSYDTGALSSSIVRIDLSSGLVQLLAGGGIEAGTPTSTYPEIGLNIDAYSLAMDSTGNVLFSGQHQAWDNGVQPNPSPLIGGIWELMASDNSIHIIAGTASLSDPHGDGGPATSTYIGLAGAICLSPKGDVVFDGGSNYIRTFPIGGNISTIAGDGYPNFFGDNGPAQQAGLDQPSGVATDAQGNVYMADKINGLVRKINATTGVITTIAGGGPLYDAAAEGAPALQVILTPVDVAPDENNHLYLRTQDTLKVIDLSTGTISTLVPFASYTGPIVFDGKKTLYYSTQHFGNAPPNNEVWAVDVTTGGTTQIAGGDDRLPNGDGGPALLAGLYDVEGLALDGEGGLYLADSGFEDIRKIDLNTGIISTIAGVHPDYPYTSGYSGDGGPATAATFNDPAGLAYDGAGHLTIVDSGNQVLRQIDLTTNIITTIAGNHTPGFGGDGGSPTAAMLYGPNAVAYDPAGNLIVADMKNDRLRRIVLHPTKLQSTLTYRDASSGGIQWTATYTGLSFGISPTGTVTLSSGGTSLGSGTLSAATDGSGNYIATITSTSMLANSAAVTAQYSGDTHYAASSTKITFQQPSYSVSASPASLSIQRGSSGSITFTVTPQNGFQEAVSFSCDASTLPKGVTCSFSPSSVTPNGSGAVTTQLTVQTTGTTQAAVNHHAAASSRWLPRGGAMLALAILLLPPVRRKTWLGFAAVLLLFALSLGGMTACGGGGSNNGGGDTQNPNATPPGSYAIHINSTVGGKDAATPVTVSLTVTG